MMSGELVPLSDEGLFREHTKTARENVDFELLFNAHGDVEDALLSASYVQPNSIVFLEGHRIGWAGASDSQHATLSDFMTALAVRRLTHGVNSTEYTAYKTAIVGDLNDWLASIDSDDEAAWGVAIHKALVEKDCIVLSADFDPRRADYSKEYLDKLEDGRQSIGSTVRGFSTSMGAGRTLLRAADWYSDYLILQHSRERTCVSVSGFTLTNLFNEYGLAESDVRRNEEGRIQAYAIWGTAHSFSLSEAFTDLGFHAQGHILNPVPELRYILPNFEQAQARTKEVVMADILYDAARLTGFGIASKPFKELLDELISAPEGGGFIPYYIRAFQLHRRLTKLSEREQILADGDDATELDEAYRNAAHNLRNLLTDLGLAADSHIRNPYVPSN